MNRINIDNLIAEIKKCVDRHNLGNYGEYARWLWGENKNLGINEYGCADVQIFSIPFLPFHARKKKETVLFPLCVQCRIL